MSDLAPLQALTNLETLNCSGCDLNRGQEMICRIESLLQLLLQNTKIPGVPPEVLSQSYDDNCLHRLRARLCHILENSAFMRRIAFYSFDKIRDQIISTLKLDVYI